MIDIHTHIIPGLDDGSDSIETSIQMARIAVKSGVNFMIATPHFNYSNSVNSYSYEEVFQEYWKLVKEIEAEQLNLDIALGMEVYATEEVPDLILKGRLITLNRSKYLLLEFSFNKDMALIDFLIEELTIQGICPIIAHPERYSFVQRNPMMVCGWLEQGCLLQLNKGSILGSFGLRAYEMAMYLLENNLVSFIASDAHGSVHRTTNMAKVYELISKAYSKEYADLLMEENPRKVIENQEIRRSSYETI